MHKNIDLNKIYERISIATGLDDNKIKSKIDEEELYLLMSNLLNSNGISSQEDIDLYINRPWDAFISPYRLTNAEKCADKIIEYINKKNGYIYVYADYDVDGIVSGTLAHRLLDKHTLGNFEIIFPNREDGYGLSEIFCEKIIKRHSKVDDVLVITVDNGITKIKETNMLIENGIEVLITDHHKSDEEVGVPNCIVVDPHNDYEEQDENTKHLCGAGVFFKVSQIIKEKLGDDSILSDVPYVALATVADVMPITSENNAFMVYALEMINSDVAEGFFSLLKDQLDCNFITAEQFLWNIGPALNACGRLGYTRKGAEALINPCIDTFNEVLRINDDRKAVTKGFKKRVEEMESDDKIIIHIADKSYCPKGTLGILAGNIAEKKNRPAMALLNTDGICHGSVRSANGIDVYKILTELKEEGLILKCNGHSQSCVCEFDINNYDKIVEAINNLDINSYALEELDEKEEQILDITLDHLCDIVYALGCILCIDGKTIKSNYVINNLTIDSFSVSKNNPANIKLKLRDGRRVRTMWAWGIADKVLDVIESTNIINLIGNIKKNMMGYGYVLDITDVY